MKKIYIYGAGTAGKQLFDLIQKDRNIYQVIAWIDDDAEKQKIKINSLEVLSFEGFQSEIQNIDDDIEVFIAIPSSSKSNREALTKLIRKEGVQVRCLPGVEYILDGKVSITEFNLASIEGVLNRQEISLMTYSDRRFFYKRNILVAGGGGSIGSELCRQIDLCNPDNLIIIDHSEFNLYSVMEYFEANNSVKTKNIVPILGSTTDSKLINNVIKKYNVDIIFHAAAYKHVPLVEDNISSSTKNNILGTKVLCDSALENSVNSFTLISSDKAVRPTNVMGASKRICELLLQAHASNKSKTIFSMVRFGNVLNSSGSVVPKFLKQLKNGGPLTVTHPDIMRYFMTIEEAASLVIKSSMIAKGGEVYLLDMGDEISIYDLAKRIIKLSGKSYHPENKDYIPIEFTGLRPGEKLREELILDGDFNVTSENKIYSTQENYFPYDELMIVINKIFEACDKCDDTEVKKLMSLVVENF